MTVRGQTKDNLAFALFSLMEDTVYTQISISALCAKAHVERSTFYRNNLSKECLVLHRISLIMNDYLASFLAEEKYAFEDYMLVLFREFEKNRTVFRMLFENDLGELLLVALQRNFDIASGVDEAVIVERYHLCFHVGGIYNYIRLWTQRDMKDSPEQLAEYVSSLFPKDFTPIRLRLLATAQQNKRAAPRQHTE